MSGKGHSLQKLSDDVHLRRETNPKSPAYEADALSFRPHRKFSLFSEFHCLCFVDT